MRERCCVVRHCEAPHLLGNLNRKKSKNNLFSGRPGKGKNESQLSHGIGLRYGGHRGVNDTKRKSLSPIIRIILLIR